MKNCYMSSPFNKFSLNSYHTLWKCLLCMYIIPRRIYVLYKSITLHCKENNPLFHLTCSRFSHRTTFYFTLHTDCNWTLKPQFRDMFLKKNVPLVLYICSTAGFSLSLVVSVYILLFQRPIEIKSGKFQKEIYVYM